MSTRRPRSPLSDDELDQLEDLCWKAIANTYRGTVPTAPAWLTVGDGLHSDTSWVLFCVDRSDPELDRLIHGVADLVALYVQAAGQLQMVRTEGEPGDA